MSGVPVRQEFCHIAPRPLGSRPTLLIFGGSQGAHAINVAITAAIGEIKGQIQNLHVIHQTGERDYNEVQAAYTRLGIPAEVSPFIDNMPQAFAQVDLVICRSGASTVAEITAAGKPAIFIPFPRAADDHQRRNAEAVAAAGAAVMIPEAELTPANLAQTIAGLLSDDNRLREMQVRARTLAHPDAAERLARMVADLAR